MQLQKLLQNMENDTLKTSNTEFFDKFKNKQVFKHKAYSFLSYYKSLRFRRNLTRPKKVSRVYNIGFVAR